MTHEFKNLKTKFLRKTIFTRLSGTEFSCAPRKLSEEREKQERESLFSLIRKETFLKSRRK